LIWGDIKYLTLMVFGLNFLKLSFFFSNNLLTFNFHTVHIVCFEAIKTTQNVQKVLIFRWLQNYTLMKCSSCWFKRIYCYFTSPCLIFKIKLINIVKSLLLLVYTTKNIHRWLSWTCTVPVSTFNTANNTHGLQPNILI